MPRRLDRSAAVREQQRHPERVEARAVRLRIGGQERHVVYPVPAVKVARECVRRDVVDLEQLDPDRSPLAKGHNRIPHSSPSAMLDPRRLCLIPSQRRHEHLAAQPPAIGSELTVFPPRHARCLAGVARAATSDRGDVCGLQGKNADEGRPWEPTHLPALVSPRAPAFRRLKFWSCWLRCSSRSWWSTPAAR